ncbi:MAG: DUF1080 domain-containing protein [Candidatus Hydrogenedentota bacterium]
MRYTLTGLFVVLACLIPFQNAAWSEEKTALDTVRLFDGTSLDHFYTFIKDRGRDSDPKNVFTIKDGLLVISGEELGCITTHKSYKNYLLVTEFKWGGGTHAPRKDKTRDSGILVNSAGPDGAYNGTWMHSIECQIIEGGTGDFIVVGDGSDALSLTAECADEQQGSSYIYEKGGKEQTIHGGRINWWGRDPGWSDTIDFRGTQDVEHPVGEWNRLECVVVDGAITVILNGVVVNRGTKLVPAEGRIQIQSEYAEILFRQITLHELP